MNFNHTENLLQSNKPLTSKSGADLSKEDEDSEKYDDEEDYEAAMKAQAKKMNVDSLKSKQKDNEASAEVKIAKVAITNVLLWVATWTPYATIAMIGVFGNQMLITPLVAQLPSFLGNLSTHMSLSSILPLPAF